MLEGLTPPPNKAQYCKIAIIEADLTDTDKKIFMDAVNNKDLWRARALSLELRKRGVDVADTTITKHRTKMCFCYRNK